MVLDEQQLKFLQQSMMNYLFIHHKSQMDCLGIKL
jgi:hypothetical protein